MRAAAILAAAAATASLPPLVGHVVDPSHQLAPGEYAALDGELEGLRTETGHAVVIYLVTSTGGESIDDLAYRAFNAWGVGDRKRDDGVLIVVATGDRRVRIETGKGVGGALTDLQANDIIRKDMGPLLAKGQLYQALDVGVHAIEAALAKDDAAGPPGARAPPASGSSDDGGSWLTGTIVVIALVVLALLAIVSPTFRNVLWPLLNVILDLVSRGGGGGGGGSGRYGGGGGRSGGGGSSDSY